VDLLIVQLKAAIRRLLDAKGVRGRVLDKVNRYGEVVIGVILEAPAGAAPPSASGASSSPSSSPSTPSPSPSTPSPSTPEPASGHDGKPPP